MSIYEIRDKQIEELKQKGAAPEVIAGMEKVFNIICFFHAHGNLYKQMKKRGEA